MPVKPLKWTEARVFCGGYPKSFIARIPDFPFSYDVFAQSEEEVEYEVLLDDTIIEEGTTESVKEAQFICEEYHNKMLRYAVE